jgi:hypothetical protein
MGDPALPGALFGGDRQFLVDPQNAGIPTSMGDMAAWQLRFIHAMLTTLPADSPAREPIVQIAGGLRQVQLASDISQAREQATRELQPISDVPIAAYGVNNNIANIKMFNIPLFQGSAADTIDIVRWLAKILNLAEANTLTLEATVRLMIQGSSGGAMDYINQMKQEHKTLHQVIQHLEMRYGDLCTPAEARIRCNSMVRKDKEGLSEFIDRMRLVARMACRLEPTEAARMLEVDKLVEANTRRVLPESVRNHLEERIVNRSQVGLPALSPREIEKLCLELEKKREERRQTGIVLGPGQVKRHVRQMQYEESPQVAMTSALSSEDEVDTDDEGTYNLICEIKEQQRKYAARGMVVGPQKIYRKAIRNYNERVQRPRFAQRGANPPERRAPQGAAHFLGQNLPNEVRQQGPPNKLEGPRRAITELLALANISRGQCIQCGLDGHMMNHITCALKDKDLMDRACTKCGKGLHSADDCMRVYQRQYGGGPQQPVGLVQPVNEEGLNE